MARLEQEFPASAPYRQAPRGEAYRGFAQDSKSGAPTIVTGGIKSPDTADSIIAKAKADLVGIGRALLKDPDWAADARVALHS
ncbi:MAG: hypothetical protein VB144_15185 [Clostridia bacterium]|nr:hypothetical protein [Clostridia bacterium]